MDVADDASTAAASPLAALLSDEVLLRTLTYADKRGVIASAGT